MIYQLNGYNAQAIFYVADQETLDNVKKLNNSFNCIIGTQADAQTALTQKQADVLAYEAVRFSICATFVNGNDTTWREVQESDPENTICQVFDTFTGSYTQVNNKTEAYALNLQKQQQFLASIGLDKLIELNDISQLPISMSQPKTSGTQTL